MAIINTTCLICLKSFTFETVRGGKPPGFCSKECKQKHNRKKNKEYNQNQKRKEYNLKLRIGTKGLFSLMHATKVVAVSKQSQLLISS